MLAKVVHIIQNVIKRIIIIGSVVLVSLTIVVLGKLAGIVMLANAVVVTEVKAIGEALQRQLHLGVEVGKE